MVAVHSSRHFSYIAEKDDFLSLFPHRYDFIHADHSPPGTKVEWRTESRYPLSDRLIQQGAYLYGVRFGSETQYCVLDIDADSPYHPKRDRYALSRIRAALEPLGLVRSLLCTSSYSGGLHLYFPFTETQITWELALVLDALLTQAGFKPALGQLEVFPNVREYSSDLLPRLYAAHRLPMQAGSYLLDDDFQPLHSTQSTFVTHWCHAQAGNAINDRVLRQTLKLARQRHYALTGKADKFLNDLNADIEPGWTGYGQTNFILGRIALRSYIFGHILKGTQPLEGKALVDDIVRVATQLPGYADWCRHQHEIEHRAEEWAMCVQNSHYFHFGVGQVTTTEPRVDHRVNWNQQQQEGARQRICEAIAQILNEGHLPATPTARFKQLTQLGIGGATLYRHRDLWHPDYFEMGENPENSNLSTESPAAVGSGSNCTSLLERNGSNALNRADLSALEQSFNPALGDNAAVSIAQIKRQLQSVQDQRQLHPARGTFPSLQLDKQRQRSQQLRERMQQYLRSGDPILQREAEAWLMRDRDGHSSELKLRY